MINAVKPIGIRCKDNFKHTQIAFLVDREDFLKDISYLRQKWLKDSQLVSSEAYDLWFNTLKTHGKTRDSLLRTNVGLRIKSGLAKELINAGKKKLAAIVIKEVDSLLRQLPNLDFKGDVGGILVRYKVPATYFKAISRIIVCNEVYEEDWKSYNLTLTPSGLEEEKIIPSRELNEPDIEIRFSPYITLKDWTVAYKENINKVIKLYEESPMGYKKYAADTVSNIRRDREWYWQHKAEGKSYQEIKVLAENNGERISRDGVIKAISRYETNLR